MSNSRTQKQHIDAQARGARPAQSRGHHLRRQPAGVPAGHALRPRGVGRDVRAHAQLRHAAGARGLVDGAGGDAVRAHLHAPRIRLPVRGARRDATGWRATSSPAASCRATTCCCISSATCACSSTGSVPGWHYRSRAKPGCRTWTGIGPSSCRCWRAPTAKPRRCAGGSTGASSSWPARNSGATRRPRMAGIALPL